ncbi:MAG: ABC transporter ATP-binding protein [Bdellovibrionales bacterium]|nr:ABC transporter ATP-binding protein [Bdellovibrionales bacterium]
MTNNQASHNDTVLELSGVTKQYGSFTAVNDISIAVKRGEIFGFLGVNGAGKTTTLRMITGILLPTRGDIKIAGLSLIDKPTEAKQITGYIPDRPYLYAKLTGREFLYFCSDLYHVPPAQADQRIDQLLEEYSLTAWQDELIESYSHGMKQRLATCAALVHEPKLLVIDEPMVGLDPHGAKMLKDALKRYAQSGTTVFLSTHSLNVAEEVADRLAIIHRGSLLITGTLDEIRARTKGGRHDLESVFIELTTEAEQQQAV